MSMLSSWSLTMSIKSIVKFVDTMRMLCVSETRWLGDVYLLLKKTLKKSIIDIQLMHVSLVIKSKSGNNFDRLRSTTNAKVSRKFTSRQLNHFTTRCVLLKSIVPTAILLTCNSHLQFEDTCEGLLVTIVLGKG